MKEKSLWSGLLMIGALGWMVAPQPVAACAGPAAVAGFAGCAAAAGLVLDERGVDPLEVPAGKVATQAMHLDARAAQRLRAQSDRIVLIDVRSRDEVAFAGWPVGADGNVPFMEPRLPLRWNVSSGGLDMTETPGFGERVAELIERLGRERIDLVIVMCRSGERSAHAADELIRYGFLRVATVIDGFEGDLDAQGRRSVNGWKNAGLPWLARVPADVPVGIGL